MNAKEPRGSSCRRALQIDPGAFELSATSTAVEAGGGARLAAAGAVASGYVVMFGEHCLQIHVTQAQHRLVLLVTVLRTVDINQQKAVAKQPEPS